MAFDPNKLRALRHAKGLTQLELAMLTMRRSLEGKTIWVQPIYISHYETGHERPSHRNQEWLAAALGCAVTDFDDGLSPVSTVPLPPLPNQA